MIEGQLKEKKGGRWKLFKKWKSRYFTLSGAKLTYKEEVREEKPRRIVFVATDNC